MPEVNDRLVTAAQELNKELIRTTVRETLFQIGVVIDDNDDIIEFRKDMAHIRKWRNAMEQVESKGLLTAVGIIITGLFALLWMGYQTMVGPH